MRESQRELNVCIVLISTIDPQLLCQVRHLRKPETHFLQLKLAHIFLVCQVLQQPFTLSAQPAYFSVEKAPQMHQISDLLWCV